MSNYDKNPSFKGIPVKLTEQQFNEFILPHLSAGSRGPNCKISLFKIFNYILRIDYTGMQWCELEIDKDKYGNSEIHYTRIFKIYKRWAIDGSLQRAFEASVKLLAENNFLDISILHGDGTTTAAKKGGDHIGYSGHKKIKGEKIIAFSDRNCNVIAPCVVASANTHESSIFKDSFTKLKNIMKNIGFSIKNIVASLDSAYDNKKNRKQIFNAGMLPNIKENPRNRKKSKRGRKRFYKESVFEERFFTIERVFAWEDKFKRLLMRFERISLHHLGMKLLAYTMINLRHFCN